MLYVTISSLDLVLPISYHVIWYNNVSCQIQYQFVLITYKSKSQHTIILYHIMKTDSVLYIIWYNTGLYFIKSYNYPCSQIKTKLKWTKKADRKKIIRKHVSSLFIEYMNSFLTAWHYFRWQQQQLAFPLHPGSYYLKWPPKQHSQRVRPLTRYQRVLTYTLGFRYRTPKWHLLHTSDSTDKLTFLKNKEKK